MKFFHLPDLGEGIPEADIVEWHVNEGDEVKEDQIIVSVETAKAVVEVPSPVTGVIARLCGQPGETILTGEPLVEFVSDNDDSGTVVGKLAQDNNETGNDEIFIIGAATGNQPSGNHPPSGSGLTTLANKYNINLEECGTGQTRSTARHYTLENPTPLKGVRKHMARLMAEAHVEVVPVTLFDDADINHWKAKEDITVRLIKAIVAACKAEPALNAWFDGATTSVEHHKQVNLGLAVDSKDGLFVPVIRSAESQSASQLRATINEIREGVNNRSIPPSELQGASITLSNFGVFAGAYATPIVVPPSVCIVGVGKLRETIVSVKSKPESHRILPLSLSFDHRAVTGGEATRFLKTIIESLQEA